MKKWFLMIVFIVVYQAAAETKTKQYLSLIGGTNGIGAGYSIFYGYFGAQVDWSLSYSSDYYPLNSLGALTENAFQMHPSIKLGAFIFPKANIRAFLGLKSDFAISYQSYYYTVQTSHATDTLISRGPAIFFSHNGFGPMVELFWYDKNELKYGIEIGSFILTTDGSLEKHAKFFCQIFFVIKEFGISEK